MSCPVVPAIAVEQPGVELEIDSISPCDQGVIVTAILIYNGQAFYDGTYPYGLGQ